MSRAAHRWELDDGPGTRLASTRRRVLTYECPELWTFRDRHVDGRPLNRTAGRSGHPFRFRILDREPSRRLARAASCRWRIGRSRSRRSPCGVGRPVRRLSGRSAGIPRPTGRGRLWASKRCASRRRSPSRRRCLTSSPRRWIGETSRRCPGVLGCGTFVRRPGRRAHPAARA